MPTPFPVLLRLCAAQGCGIASLAEGTAVPLMQCHLLVRAGIWNLAMVLANSLPLLCERRNGNFNVHQRMLVDGIPINEGRYTH